MTPYEAFQAELEQRRRDEEREWANKQLEADPEYTDWVNKSYEEYEAIRTE